MIAFVHVSLLRPRWRVHPTHTTLCSISETPARVHKLPPPASAPSYPSPLLQSPIYRRVDRYFVDETDAVLASTLLREPADEIKTYIRAGPREQVAFRSEDVHAAIVTCGGVCPGMNVIIKELVRALRRNYSVAKVSGIRNGYRGFYTEELMPFVDLHFEDIEEIHRQGGTVLGTSRGGFDCHKIIDAIVDAGINQLYVVGGDGTMRGAAKLFAEIERRQLRIAVVMIPKTIDNDICVIDRSFGFETAVDAAQNAIYAANVEARSFPNAVGLVKLMGRSSGFIAMHASISAGCVDCCLIPEAPFSVSKLLDYIDECLRQKGRAVVVVAEGAGQELVGQFRDGKDASGNALLGDVGLYLATVINAHFKERQKEISLKYIDPTYTIRAVPSIASDNMYCALLAHAAVHGGMAGFTGFVVGPINGRHCYIPVDEVVNRQNFVDITDRIYARMLSTTGQPVLE